jgi:hypothetical protein
MVDSDTRTIEEHPRSIVPEFTPDQIKDVQEEAANKVVHIERQTNDLLARPEYFISEDDAYEWLLKRQIAGDTLSDEETCQMQEFETSGQYKDLKPYWERVCANFEVQLEQQKMAAEAQG